MTRYHRPLTFSYLYLCFLVLTSCPPGAFARSPLILGTCDSVPFSGVSGTGFSDLILKEAFRRAGISIDIVELPGERSLANVSEGITDGDFVRIAGLEKMYPNLVMVPEKIIDFEFVGFSKNKDIVTSDWEALQPYDVAVVRGWKILEENITGTRSLAKMKDQWLLFTLLEKNRVDIVVHSRYEGYVILKRLGITDIYALEPPLAIREMYLYLNRKHRALVPVIARHLREMKRDGTFRKIGVETLTPLSPGAVNAPKE